MSDKFPPSTHPGTLQELVCYYHGIHPKLKYKDIYSIIVSHHKKNVSMSQMKAILKSNGLNRKRNVSENILKGVIENELQTSLSKVGYRQMTENVCMKYGFCVSKEDVRRAIKEVDPEGVESRKYNTIKRRTYWSLGPGNVYHLDGNDKLKRWGFCIHGFVDGFSRKFLWLVVASSNNDPLIIGNYYLQCISHYKFCPRLLRMDRGRENIYCEDLQVFFTGSTESFLYANSTRNQRIEAYWSRLKKFSHKLVD